MNESNRPSSDIMVTSGSTSNDSLKVSNKRNEDNLYLRYHESELSHNDTIIKHCIWFLRIGIVFIGIGLLISWCKGSPQWFPLASGGFVELFSGGMIGLINKSSDNKLKYYESLSKSRSENRLIDIVNELDDDAEKYKLLGKIINGHYR
ncbi:hypothetical protein [Eubacterium sp. AB3007]|uniref:hypothetical protein n=1 Tax=Eubacterium sp. AB3007 TaxID=1392487 RepID=UPI000485B36D|nr:hypothetical protein [Eubacterium sp. AB3007]